MTGTCPILFILQATRSASVRQSTLLTYTDVSSSLFRMNILALWKSMLAVYRSVCPIQILPLRNSSHLKRLIFVGFCLCSGRPVEGSQRKQSHWNSYWRLVRGYHARWSCPQEGLAGASQGSRYILCGAQTLLILPSHFHMYLNQVKIIIIRILLWAPMPKLLSRNSLATLTSR